MRRPGILAPKGTPSDLNMMLYWRPGAVTCYYDYLRANNLFNYKAQHPSASIIVRFQHPLTWWQDPEQTALSFGRQVAGKWDELLRVQCLNECLKICKVWQLSKGN